MPKNSVNGQKAYRLVVDFRKLNKKFIADKLPLPRIDNILDQLGRSKWFSVVDLASGFHQVTLDEESRDLTSFSVDKGPFRFTRLPFGLSVSPNSFQRMMTIAFAGITPERAFLDIETSQKYNLKINPEKYSFF